MNTYVCQILIEKTWFLIEKEDYFHFRKRAKAHRFIVILLAMKKKKKKNPSSNKVWQLSQDF